MMSFHHSSRTYLIRVTREGCLDGHSLITDRSQALWRLTLSLSRGHPGTAVAVGLGLWRDGEEGAWLRSFHALLSLHSCALSGKAQDKVPKSLGNQRSSQTYVENMWGLSHYVCSTKSHVGLSRQSASTANACLADISTCARC